MRILWIFAVRQLFDKTKYTSLLNIWTYQLLRKKIYTTCVLFYTSLYNFTQVVYFFLYNSWQTHMFHIFFVKKWSNSVNIHHRKTYECWNCIYAFNVFQSVLSQVWFSTYVIPLIDFSLQKWLSKRKHFKCSVPIFRFIHHLWNMSYISFWNAIKFLVSTRLFIKWEKSR